MLIRTTDARARHRARIESASRARSAERPIRHWFLVQLSVALMAWAVIIYGVHYVL